MPVGQVSDSFRAQFDTTAVQNICLWNRVFEVPSNSVYGCLSGSEMAYWPEAGMVGDATTMVKYQHVVNFITDLGHVCTFFCVYLSANRLLRDMTIAMTH